MAITHQPLNCARSSSYFFRLKLHIIDTNYMYNCSTLQNQFYLVIVSFDVSAFMHYPVSNWYINLFTSTALYMVTCLQVSTCLLFPNFSMFWFIYSELLVFSSANYSETIAICIRLSESQQILGEFSTNTYIIMV